MRIHNTNSVFVARLPKGMPFDDRSRGQAALRKAKDELRSVERQLHRLMKLVRQGYSCSQQANRRAEAIDRLSRERNSLLDRIHDLEIRSFGYYRGSTKG